MGRCGAAVGCGPRASLGGSLPGMRTIVVSVIADERPGLVAELAGVVAEHGGNWLESQMGRLAGKFAGAVLVQVAEDRVEGLTAALGQLSHVGVVDVSTAGSMTAEAEADTVALQVVGQDQPGIVREVTTALAEHGLSIEQLTTATSDAPMSGETLFEAVAVVRLSAGQDLSSVRSSLDELSTELRLDIQFDDGGDGPAWGEVPDRS